MKYSTKCGPFKVYLETQSHSSLELINLLADILKWSAILRVIIRKVCCFEGLLANSSVNS